MDIVSLLRDTASAHAHKQQTCVGGLALGALLDSFLLTSDRSRNCTHGCFSRQVSS